MESPMILVMGIVHNLILSFIVGGIIFKVSFQPKKHLMFGLVAGLSVYAVRNLFLTLGLPLGLNVFVNLGLAVLIFKYIFELENWKKSFVSTTVIYLIMIINETLTLQPILNFFKTDIQTVLNNTLLHLEVGMIQNLGLLVIMLLAYLVRKYIVDRRINKVCQ